MTAALVLAFVKAHWQKLAIATAALALFAGGRCSKSCPVCAPAVHLAEETKTAAVLVAQTDTTSTKGPTHEVIDEKFTCAAFPAPAPPPSPDQVKFAPLIQPPAFLPQLIERTTTIDDGASTTVIKAATEQQTQQDTQLKLDVTPAPAVSLPRFSVFWQPQVKPGWQLGEVGADVRLTDRLWLGAWVAPLETGTPAGASLRISF